MGKEMETRMTVEWKSMVVVVETEDARLSGWKLSGCVVDAGNWCWMMRDFQVMCSWLYTCMQSSLLWVVCSILMSGSR